MIDEYVKNWIIKADNDFENIDIKGLSNFAVDVRYPDDMYIPDMEEVKFYYALTKQIRGLILPKLK